MTRPEFTKQDKFEDVISYPRECSLCKRIFPDQAKYHCHLYYERHKEKIKKMAKMWSNKNPEKRRAIVKTNNYKSKLRKRLWHESKYFGAKIHLWDHYGCKICKTHKNLIIHHRDGKNGRDGKRANNLPENLVVLCRSCHPRVHNRHWVKEVIQA